jgi:hypothetical protein
VILIDGMALIVIVIGTVEAFLLALGQCFHRLLAMSSATSEALCRWLAAG